ncbi:flavoprotein [Robertmurraya massiliosenegalensis]|uniref:flavoprotein n=1 Tax=Robertmurraya massiliosenegalensis TaxID=1287657 RepID=UPI0002D8BB27|nr:flavoprotein [Robertmurraya massiliosenegalensis]
MGAHSILDSFVEEVIRRLQKRTKKATVLFTGGYGGFQEALEQIHLLQNDGWDLKIVLSNSAEYVPTPQLISDKVGTANIFVEKDIKELRPLYEGISVFLVPTLTINTMVKISLGIADNMVTNLASHMLMSGIPFIAAKDACDVSHVSRQQLGLNKGQQAYLHKMSDYLGVLESYGVKLVDAKDLFQTVQHNVFTFSQQVEKGVEKKRPIISVKKKIVTREDVVEAKRKEATIQLPYATIISPLALDTAKELGVQIVQENEGR